MSINITVEGSLEDLYRENRPYPLDYKIYEYGNRTRYKVGDGKTKFVDLPWFGTDVDRYSVQEEVFGFATLGDGVTGGAGGEIILVTSDEDFATEVADDLPKIIYIDSKTYTGPGNDAYITIGSNKTIIGLPGATFVNIPLRIYDSENVIIKNLKFKNVVQGTIDGDAVGIKRSTNIWIDHCEFSADRLHDYEYYDGLLDFTNTSNYLTVTYCIFSDSLKAFLAGGTTGDNAGLNNATVAYNLFRRCTERTVRQQNSTIHLINNYYENCRSTFNINNGNDGDCSLLTHDSVARYDNNYYKNSNRPIRTTLDGSSGFISNHTSNYYAEDCGDNVITTTLSTYNPSYSYQDKVIPVMEVPDYVTKNAGAILDLTI